MGWKVKENSGIYAIRCVETNKVYIGRTQNLERRLKEHAHELRKCAKTVNGKYGREISDFQRDYNKYGEDAFESYLLEEEIPPDTVQAREAYWIDQYRATEPEYGYNKKSEQVSRGFSVVKRGAPPKPKEADFYERFAKLTPKNQELVRSEIKRLLEQQEREERKKV